MINEDEKIILKGMKSTWRLGQIKKLFKEEYKDLLERTKTAVGIAKAAEDGYYLTLRPQVKSEELEKIWDVYHGALVGFQYIDEIRARKR